MKHRLKEKTLVNDVNHTIWQKFTVNTSYRQSSSRAPTLDGLPVWWKVFSGSPPPCWSRWLGSPRWWSRCIPCTETSYTGASGIFHRSQRSSRAGRSSGSKERTCSESRRQVITQSQTKRSLQVWRDKMLEFVLLSPRFRTETVLGLRLNIAIRWSHTHTSEPTNTHTYSHTHSHTSMMIFPIGEISWHLSCWVRLCLLMTRLAAMTGIHGVSSSEWFPISQSVPGNKQLSPGVIAFSWNSKRHPKSTRAPQSREDAHGVIWL